MDSDTEEDYVEQNDTRLKEQDWDKLRQNRIKVCVLQLKPLFNNNSWRHIIFFCVMGEEKRERRFFLQDDLDTYVSLGVL